MPKSLKLEKLYKKLAKDIARIVLHKDTPPEVLRVLNEFRIELQEDISGRGYRAVLAGEMRAGVEKGLIAQGQ